MLEDTSIMIMNFNYIT